jgi:hypothetical protein
MMKPFKADVKSMARAMDPSEGYVGQTAEAKEKLMERILDEYEFHGGSGKVSKAYIKIVVGKALIKYRHELNKLVDAGSNKPHDILSEFWTKLQKKRKTDHAQLKSNAMREIATNRGMKGTNLKSIERTAISRLVMQT